MKKFKVFPLLTIPVAENYVSVIEYHDFIEWSIYRMWFTFSLLTVFAWSGSDLFSKRGTRPSDPLSHLRIIVIVGAVMGLHAIGFMLFTQTTFDPMNIARYLPVSLMYILSMALGYAGLRYIELSVSSPICNSSGAVTSLLCFLVLKQTMEGMQLFGAGVIVLGIVLLAVLERKYADPAPKTEDNRRFRVGVIAILFPILYCVIDGLGSFMDAYYLENLMDEAQANLSYEFTFLICAVLAFLYLRLVKKDRAPLIREHNFILAALCETAGQFTYVYAMADSAIVAAPLIASYSIFSVLWSRLFLKEKLKAPQYAVIVMVMAGIAILGYFDA